MISPNHVGDGRHKQRRDPSRVTLSQSEAARTPLVGGALRNWYAREGRRFVWREWRDPYKLTVVEVLLQRTRAQTVAVFAPQFFERFPDWPSLANAPTPELTRALKPIGLHTRRAETLRALAQAVLVDGIDPTAREAPGVGQYIQRAVRVASSGADVAMVDSNWVRLLRRIFGGSWKADYRYDGRLQTLAESVVVAAGDSRAVNWAVLDVGATICLPRRPRCQECPAQQWCEFATAPKRSVTGASI